MTDVGELTDALRCSRAWLATAGCHPDASLRHALQGLLGVWACDRALGEESASAELSDLVDAGLAKLGHEREAGSFNPYAHDPKLLLVCLSVFEREGHKAPAIRTFADSIAGALVSLPQIPARQAGVAAVLDELGYPGISAAALPVPDEPDFDALLRGGPEAVRAACSSGAAATHFGARRIDVASFEALRRALPIVLLQSLRSYDLDTAAMLVRTSRYLGMRSSGRIREGIAFLVDQQKPDGRFGFFAVETSALLRSQELAGFDEVLTLYLPVTSTCAWALAEVLSDECVLFARPRRRTASESQVPSYIS
jgi:hypothetical protein